MDKLAINGRELVNAAAGPWLGYDTKRSRFARAAENAGITERSVRAVFYGQITSGTSRSVRALETAARSRAGALQTRLAQIAGRLRNSCDADFAVFDLAALDEMVSALGRMARAKE